MTQIIKSIAFCILLATYSNLKAQDYNLGVTAAYGINIFMGDISGDITGSGGMGFYYSPINQLDLGGTFNFGTLKGSDKGMTYMGHEGLRFYTTYYEYGIKAKYNLYHHIDPNPFAKYSFYVTAGAGFINFVDKLENLNGEYLGGYGYKNSELLKDKNTTEVYIPVGLGFKYRVNNNMSVSLEPNYVYVNTDKLDFLSTNDKKDSYIYLPIVLEYKFKAK